MSRAGDLSRAVRALDRELDARSAGRVLRALAAFTWYEIRLWKNHGKQRWPVDERPRMQAYRRADRRWRRAVVESAAFARVYTALPVEDRSSACVI